MPISSDTFSRQAIGGQTPYAFQRRLARGEPPRSQISIIESEMHGVPCASQLINIPTGLGKTAIVVLSTSLAKMAERR